MNDIIEPLSINLPEEISHYTMMQISVKNSFAFCNEDGIFKQASIDDKGKVYIKVLSPGFPNHMGECESDDRSDIIWLRRGRGVYFYDMRDGITCHTVSATEGKLLQVMVADPERKLVIMQTATIGKDLNFSNIYYVQHDIKNDNRVFKKEAISVGPYLLSSGELLFEDSKWTITDTTLEKRIYNKLTKLLDTSNLWSKFRNSKNFDAKARILLGTIPNPVDDEYPIPVMIRWSEDYEDVNLTPLIAQQPNGRSLDDFWRLNQGGTWTKTRDCDIPGFPPQVLFMHIGNYPGGMSLPVKGGYTYEIIKGVWIDHEQWGPCYVEMQPENARKLLLYKMTDALKLLPGIMARAATKK